MKAVHSLSVGYVVTSACQPPLVDQIAELERRRVRVQVLALNGRTGRVLVPPLRPVPGGSRPDAGPILRPWLARTAAWIAREAGRHHVAHLHACGSIRAVAAAGEAARLAGVGFSYASDGDRTWLQRRALDKYLAGVRFISVPSRSDLVDLAAVDEALAGRAHVLPEGIDLRSLTFQRSRPEPTGRMLVVATNGNPRAIRQLIDLLPELDLEDQHARLAVWAPTLPSAVLRGVHQAHSGERRVVPIEPQPSGDVAAIAVAYDLVVWVNRDRRETDTPPLGILQAMAIGVPVVHVTDAVRDVIEDGRNGFVVPFGSPEILVKAMRAALWHHPVRRRIARAARRRVEREFNMPVACARLRRLFAESAVAGAATGTPRVGE